MLSHYLAPVRGNILDSAENLHQETLFHKLRIHREIEGIPDLNGVKIALVGVMDDRGSKYNAGAAEGPDSIRRFLYPLFAGKWNYEIADLGNIYMGEEITDTYFALQEVCVSLLKEQIIPVILGGSQDLTYANYRSYDQLEQTVNLVSIDSRFDLGKHEDGLHDESYLSHIIINKPYNLFNFANIGYQTYFVNQEEIALMERLNFEISRLGQTHGNIQEVEPIVRDADIVSFDLGCIRFPDAPTSRRSSPNGFSAEEACAIARYIGLSDKVTSFGLYQYNPNQDDNKQGAHLVAQMVWYFLEGVGQRKGDYPFSSKNDYLKFNVLLEEGDHTLIFYKSPLSERWWIEVPIGDKASERHTLIPCSYPDYQSALEGEMPQRWWKAKQRGI